MSAMPTTPAAMRRHMMAEPPAGHGMNDMPDDMPMGDMEERHAAMHSRGAEHEHTGMASAGRPARKAFTPHDLKLSETGEIELAFAQLNVIDHDGDVTLPGAFPAKDVPMSAYGHTSWDGTLPVGKGTISESGEWAVFKGQFFMDTTGGRETHATIKGLGPLAEYSYGYRPVKFSFGQRENQQVRFLELLDVSEVSPVLMGAGIGTHTRAIKSGGPGSDLPLTEHGSWVREQVSEYLDRVASKAALREADGRTLSGMTREELSDLAKLLDSIAPMSASLDGILAATDPDRAARQRRTEIDVLIGQARSLGVPI